MRPGSIHRIGKGERLLELEARLGEELRAAMDDPRFHQLQQ